MKITGRRFIPSIVGLTCIGALTACSQGASPSATPTESLPPGVVVVSAPMNTVAEQYQRSEDEAHEALQKAIGTCMKERGFNYEPAPRDASTSSYSTLTAQRYGDTEGAKTDGLGVMTRISEILKLAEEQNIPTGGTSDQSPEYSKALFGEDISQGGQLDPNDPDVITIKSKDGQAFPVSAKGCMFSARKEMVPDLAKYLQDSATIGEMISEVQLGVSQDSRFKEAETKWISCMKEAGYSEKPRTDYVDEFTQKAFQAGADEKKQDEVRQEEIKIGAAITQCDRDSNLGNVTKEVQTEKEKKALEDNQGFIAGWKESTDEMVKRAKDYLNKK